MVHNFHEWKLSLVGLSGSVVNLAAITIGLEQKMIASLDDKADIGIRLVRGYCIQDILRDGHKRSDRRDVPIITTWIEFLRPLRR